MKRRSAGNAKTAFYGVFPPMLTPFLRDGDVDYDAHVRNIARWNREELGGYLVLGSNSETPYLNEEEKLRLIARTVEHAKSGRTVMAGTGLESTAATIRLTKKAATLGADAARVRTPSYYGGRMSDDAFVNHFRRVADASPIPILVYNVPVYTHLSISVRAVGILSRHPNIAGMKESSPDIGRLGSILREVPPTFSVIAGSVAAWLPALGLGIRAAILAVANIVPGHAARVQRYYESGKHDRARKSFLQLLPLNAAISSRFGIAGLKYAAALAGYEGGYVRAPLLELAPREKSEIRRTMASSGFL